MPTKQRLSQQLAGNYIEAASFSIISETMDLSRFDREEREVIARIVHSCADPSIAESLAIQAGAISAAIGAIQSGGVVITDVEMVKSALYFGSPVCMLGEIRQSEKNKTRTQLGVERAALKYPQGSIFVIGCAPTALETVIELTQQGTISPSAIIALPVGYVGAAQAKAHLVQSQLPYITNIGVRGGSAITAAAFNAIARMAAGIYSFEAAVSSKVVAELDEKGS